MTAIIICFRGTNSINSIQRKIFNHKQPVTQIHINKQDLQCIVVKFKKFNALKYNYNTLNLCCVVKVCLIILFNLFETLLIN